MPIMKKISERCYQKIKLTSEQDSVLSAGSADYVYYILDVEDGTVTYFWGGDSLLDRRETWEAGTLRHSKFYTYSGAFVQEIDERYYGTAGEPAGDYSNWTIRTVSDFTWDPATALLSSKVIDREERI